MTKEIKGLPGNPRVLGANFVADPSGGSGLGCAVFSEHTDMQFEVFRNPWDEDPMNVMPMNRIPWKEVFGDDVPGYIHHVFVPGLASPTLYNIRVNGKRVLDPYAQAHTGKPVIKDAGVVILPKCVAYQSTYEMRHSLPRAPITAYDPIYEVLVPGFTEHPSSQCNGLKGTYRGMIQKIPHLVALGIRSVELMPIQEWDPNDTDMFVDPVTGLAHENSWGYNTFGFFAPDSNFAAWGRLGTQIDEFKMLVDAFHKAGIRVILDVVYNHTREGNEKGPTLSFRALGDSTYYLRHGGGYDNWTGVGNTLNTNHPVVRKMILDSMKYWVEKMGVDGTRHDLAGVYAVGQDGQVRGKTETMRAIEEDQVLAGVPMIVEPYTCGDHRMVSFFDGRWIRWCTWIRDNLRRWVKGDEHLARGLWHAITEPHKVAYVTCHDGFTLMDLVSFNGKNNWRNGNKNQDGDNAMTSWDCGWGGDLSGCPLPEIAKDEIRRLRRTQIRNFITLLCSCVSTIMIYYGDEYGRSNGGNNNTFCQGALNQLDWSLGVPNGDIFNYWRKMFDIREKYFMGSRDLKPQPLTRQGKTDDAYWAGKVLAWTRISPDGRLIYQISNTWDTGYEVELPELEGGRYYVLADTFDGESIYTEETAPAVHNGVYHVRPRSCAVLIYK